MPVIEQELHIGHGTVGAYFLVLSMGYSVALVGGQLLAPRLSHKQIIALSSIGVGMALISNLVISNSRGLFLFFLLLGVSSGLYLPSGLTVTTAIVATSSWGFGIAIHELAPSLGYLAVPLVAEGAIRFLNWRSGMALVGCASFTIGIAYSILGQGSDLYGAAMSFGTIRKLLAKKAIGLSIVLFGLAMALSYGLYVMMPLYLVAERGWPREVANLTISFSRLPAMVGLLGTGWAIDRIGPRRIMWLSLFLSGCASILLSLSPDAWLAFIIPVQALLVVSFFPAGFALLSAATQLSTRSIGISLILASATLFGQGLVPLLLGFLGDAGSFSLAIGAVGVAAILGAFLIVLIEEPQGQAAQVE